METVLMQFAGKTLFLVSPAKMLILYKISFLSNMTKFVKELYMDTFLLFWFLTYSHIIYILISKHDFIVFYFILELYEI